MKQFFLSIILAASAVVMYPFFLDLFVNSLVN
jgi:hypothetical protein